MATEPFQTAEGSEYPFCTQISVFVENRLGQLLRLTRLLESEPVAILAVSVEGSVDCAIVRLLVSDPEAARRMISGAGFAITETELIVVELPPGKRAILSVCAALIQCEVNINYLYPLFSSGSQPARLAMQVDNAALAASILATKDFKLVDQSELA